MRPGARRLAALAAAAALAAGCAPERKTERLRYRVTKRLSAVVAQIAAAEGFFRDEGLDVELVDWNLSRELVPSVENGEIDVMAIGSLDPSWINVIARGAKLRFVAAGTTLEAGDCGYAAIVARPELLASGRLGAPDSVRGLRIAADRSDTDSYVWSRLLRDAGLDWSAVETHDLNSRMKVDALHRDLIDLTILNEPNASRAVRAGLAGVWRTVGDTLPGEQIGFLIFSPRLLGERRDLGLRFLRAHLRAARRYREQGASPRHVEILSAALGIPAADLASMCWPGWSATGEIDRQGLERYQEWAHAAGVIDAVLPYGELVDNGFVEALGSSPPGESG